MLKMQPKIFLFLNTVVSDLSAPTTITKNTQTKKLFFTFLCFFPLRWNVTGLKKYLDFVFRAFQKWKLKSKRRGS